MRWKGGRRRWWFGWRLESERSEEVREKERRKKGFFQLEEEREKKRKKTQKREIKKIREKNK